jgi:thiosulfate/3-mercaptopyruvate sulfurtransferase
VIAPFVSQDWWSEHRDEVVLVEVCRDMAAAARRPHAEGAVRVDLDRWLAAPATPQDGRHPLPTPEVFAEGMSRAGIGDTDTVVAYDDAGGVFAARLVWMLRVTGHEAALLDGGLPPDHPTGAPAQRPPTTFTARPWPQQLLADMGDVTRPGQVLIDARERERFLGAPDPRDPQPGHVPGARSVPCRENLDAAGRLLGDDVLRERFAAAGVEGSAPVVSYCGSGVTACHNLLVMEHLGLPSARLYPGSWSQWASTAGQPIERAAER